MPFCPSITGNPIMSMPCEVSVKCVLPAVRAMLAKELVKTKRMKQADVAHILKVSQPAVSLYTRRIRGTAISLENDKDISKLVRNFAASMSKNSLSSRDTILKYCEICKTIRAKGLLCKLHKAFDASIDIETCELCRTNNPLSCI